MRAKSRQQLLNHTSSSSYCVARDGETGIAQGWEERGAALGNRGGQKATILATEEAPCLGTCKEVWADRPKTHSFIYIRYCMFIVYK